MKAVVFDSFGSGEHIRFKNMPDPETQEGEVKIKIEYAGVNPVDWKIGAGVLHDLFPHDFPIILGWDASGLVVEVGKGVKNFKEGDQVYTYCRKPRFHWGTYAEYVCVDAEHVAYKPRSLNMQQAAAIPLVALTAWQALFDVADLSPEQFILIHAGAGGVGSIAIQLAKHVAEAWVITTASKKNHAYVKELGADHIIDYTQNDFETEVKKILTYGLDVVFDCVGGEVTDRSFAVLRKKGMLMSIVGSPDRGKAQLYDVRVSPVFVRPNGMQLSKITELFDEGLLVPPSIEEYPFDETLKAIQQIRSEHTRGKLVIKIKN